MATARNTNHGTGICSVCREEKSLTANLRIRSHKIKGVSCAGGSDLPYDPAKDGDEETVDNLATAGAGVDDDPFGNDAPTDRPTRVHPDDDVFGNGPFPENLEIDDRPTLFDVRNARKVIASQDVPEEVMDEAERILAVYDTEGVKGGERQDTFAMLPEMGQTDETFAFVPPAGHVHQFEYADDGNGHSGSFCSCGVLEPPVIPAKPSHDGPNPHRAPLSRGHLAAVPDVPPEMLDDVNEFMSDGPAPHHASTADQINDFMGSDEPEEEKTPPWFPSRYDGSCKTCGADFGEGEEIRADGSGGWEARECCGDDAAPVQDRPKVVYPKPVVRNGRYHLPHPETGEKANWTRVTNFNKKASDHFALEQWGNRCLAVGLRKREDLFKQVAGKDVKADRNFLNKLVEEAKQAAGSKDRARLGTIMHKHTEQVDAGHKTLGDVPDQFRNDVSVYLAKMRACGLMMVPHLMERSTVVAELGVAGTFDGVVRLPDGTYAVADKKTGETLEYNQFEIAVQLAVYAHGANSSGVAVAVTPNIEEDGEGQPPTWGWEPLMDEDGNKIKVREDIGYVIHLPYGSGECFVYTIPLDVGWEGAQLCKRVQESQKIKHLVAAVPEIQPSGIVAELQKATAGAGTVADIFAEAEKGFDVPTAANTGKTQVMTWMDRFAAVTSKEKALELYAEAQAAGTSAPVLKAMVEVGKGALQALAKKPAADPVRSRPTPSEPTWEDRFAAVTSKEEAGILYRGAKSKGLSSGRLVELAEIGRAALKKLEEPAAPAQPTWEDRFMLITSKDEARDLYREAKDQVAPERLKDLVDRGKKALAANQNAGPTSLDAALSQVDQEMTWEDRFAAVTTKEQARELYTLARAEVATLGMTRLNALVKRAQQALSYLEEPPFQD